MVVDPTHGSGNCVTPSVAISAPSAFVPCGTSVMISWSSLDVGSGAGTSVTITPTIGSVTPDMAGSQSVTINGTTTFTITAINSCGTAVESIDVAVIAPVISIDLNKVVAGCGGTNDVILSWQTTNLADGATVVISADTAVDGFPMTVTANAYGTYTFPTTPIDDTTFTITATDACGVTTDTVSLTIEYTQPSLNFVEGSGDECVINLAWSGTFCGTAVWEMKGPGVSSGLPPYDFDEWAWVPGFLSIDPLTELQAEDREMFIEGVDGGYRYQYEGRLTADGDVLLDGPDICLAPKAVLFEVDNGTQTGPTTWSRTCDPDFINTDVMLNWGAWWAGSGVNVYDGKCNLVATDLGVEGPHGYYSGQVTVTITEDTVFTLVPVTTCKEACNTMCITVTVDCSECNEEYTPPDPVYLNISNEDLAAINALASCCSEENTIYYPTAYEVWDKSFVKYSGDDYKPNGGDLVGLMAQSGEENIFAVKQVITDPPEEFFITLERKTSYLGFDCCYILNFNTNFSFFYLKEGSSPVGTYTLWGNDCAGCGAPPTTITITEDEFPTPPDTCEFDECT